MAYAQTNYGQIQGINGKYTIAQIGCFITSFCNLEQRFGTNIDPPTINNEFRNRGIYIDVDDGIRDDVGWGSITAYDPTITVVATGAGAPSSDNSIVKFNYRSVRTGAFTTHFCLVHSAANGQIIDSWDGQIKSWAVYGGPVAYATYGNNKPQPVTPRGGETMNQGDVTNMYRVLLGRDPDPSGLANYTGKTWHDAFYDIAGSPEYRNRQQTAQKTLEDLRVALENEKNKPPVEVIKEVEKIIEKPVEVVKEVPIYVHDEETKQNVNKLVSMVTSIFDYFKGQYKTFSKYIKKG